jgi:hypothetical protein
MKTQETIWLPVWEHPEEYVQLLLVYRVKPDCADDAPHRTRWTVGAGYLTCDGWHVLEEEDRYEFQVAAWAEMPEPPEIFDRIGSFLAHSPATPKEAREYMRGKADHSEHSLGMVPPNAPDQPAP